LKIALFGGSFDPIHNGHIRCAETVFEQLNCDKLIFIPTFMSPFKTESLFTAKQRYSLIETLIPDLSINASVSSLDTDKPGPSWTIDTLRQIKKIYSNADLYWCCGSDSLQTLPQWKQSSELATLVTIACYKRGNDSISAPDNFKLIHLKQEKCDISSTEIRRKLIENIDVSEDIPKGILNKVKEYIDVNRLNR
jgi:nicotinate-nucleotide adenylyltransferase